MYPQKPSVNSGINSEAKALPRNKQDEALKPRISSESKFPANRSHRSCGLASISWMVISAFLQRFISTGEALLCRYFPRLLIKTWFLNETITFIKCTQETDMLARHWFQLLKYCTGWPDRGIDSREYMLNKIVRYYQHVSTLMIAVSECRNKWFHLFYNR